MEFFFADDSSQKASRKGMGTVLAFGGILVPANLLADMKDEVDRVATEFGIPECEEIKWSPNKGSWIYQNLHGDQRKNCYQKLLEAAKDSKCSVIVVAWDLEKSELQKPEALEMVYNYTFERVTNQLNAKNKQGVIVADRPGGGPSDESSFLTSFLGKINYGTQFSSDGRLATSVLTTPSKFQRHLQIADLVVGITCAMVGGNTNYSAPLFPIVKEMLCESSSGKRAGVGLKVFPDDWRSLYESLLDESS